LPTSRAPDKSSVRLALVLIATTLALGVADAPALTARDRAPAAADGAQRITELLPLESDVLEKINDLRRSKGLRALRLNHALSLAALAHSKSMAEHGFFEHSAWDGSSFWKRIRPAYPPLPDGSWGVGENLVWAAPDLNAEQALALWLKSPPHRENLLTPAWREVGLGCVHVLGAPGAYQGLDVTIITADFGHR
jgi:uncharacterized protein YkwD